jgi:hypothetical protein
MIGNIKKIIPRKNTFKLFKVSDKEKILKSSHRKKIQVSRFQTESNANVDSNIFLSTKRKKSLNS